MDFKDLNTNDALNKLHTSVKGLTKEEALKRQKKYGLNTYYFNSEFLKLFLNQLFNPIVNLLVIAFVLSINLNYTNMITISIIILITLICNIILEYKNEYPINFENLRKKVIVIRNGRKTKISPKYITIGDIVIIEKNKYIKADMKIIVGNDIKVNSPLNNTSDDILLSGDYVIDGGGMGAVYNIGKKTEIHKLSKKIEETKKERLPFKSFMNNLNKKIFLFSIIILSLEFIILYLMKYSYSYILESLTKTIIILSPISIVIMLILIHFKRKEKNIKINSLNSLGSISDITTLILNKNTLCINELTAKIVILEDGSIYEIEGNGYNDIGDIISVNPSSRYKDSLYNLGLIGKLGYLNNKAKLEYINNKWEYSGNEYDIGMLSLNQKINHSVFENKIIQEIKKDDYEIVFYKENEDTYVSIKGKIEKILDFCDTNKDEILEKYDYLKSNGCSVLGIGETKIKYKKKYSEKDAKNLNFLGLIGFINPLKENITDNIENLKNKGINVIVLNDENENSTEILGKRLNLISKRKEISNSTDINHNFNLGERVFDSFVKEIKMLSNVESKDLIKVTNYLKKQGEIIGIIGSEDIEVIKNSHISICDNNSIIKNVCDLNINDDLEIVTEIINKSKDIKTIIINTINYLLYSNITVLLLVLSNNIFNSFNLSIIKILSINLISIILSFIPILSLNNDISCNYTKTIVSKKKDHLKWILDSILNFVITYMFILILNKLEINDNSIIFMISLLNTNLLFYYYDNSIFNLKIKYNFKYYLFIIIFILLELILFIFLNINYISLFISISLSLIPILIIECMKKVEE